jgi:hypothetical protein
LKFIFIANPKRTCSINPPNYTSKFPPKINNSNAKTSNSSSNSNQPIILSHGSGTKLKISKTNLNFFNFKINSFAKPTHQTRIPHICANLKSLSPTNPSNLSKIFMIKWKSLHPNQTVKHNNVLTTDQHRV